MKFLIKIRRGDRLISPEMRDVIDARHYHGWQDPIIFDDEAIVWDW